MELVPLATVDPHRVETLLDDAFGADRHGRTAYLLRPDTKAIGALSFALTDTDKILGTIQCWPVHIGSAKLVLIGPVAVSTALQGTGLGTALMEACLQAAALCGEPAMVMIGDPEYYGRFGFSSTATAGWTLPGPWEARRLLARNLGGHILPVSGLIEQDTDAL